MDALDAVLPVYVDYLGSFEYLEGFLETHEDVMKELLTRGVKKGRFLPGGELSIANGYLVLKDNIERVVAERFPLSQVKSPIAFISKDQDPNEKSGYSRVVVIKEEGAGHYNNTPLFHAFQCLESNPQDLVEMIQSGSEDAVSPLNRQMSKNSMDNNWIFNGTDSVRSATIKRGSSTYIPYQNGKTSTPTAVPLVTPDTEHALLLDRPRRMYETTDNPIERYTILLNLCIEDIEQFCAEVKNVRQIERDRRAQSGGPIRTSLQANDFVRIFQKLKLCFNLLGYLQGHIKDPDAEELLHHLFPPLAYLVDECYELFDEDIVKEVVAPLPTRKSVRLLSQQLNERERAIWRALGNYWMQPRSNWDGDIPAYKPIFHGGWTPGVINVPDDDDVPDTAAIVERTKRESSVSSSIDDSMFSTKNAMQDDFRDALMAKNARIALVTFSKERKDNKQLSIRKGEYLQVLDDERNWWKCKNFEGEVGFVPKTFLKAIIYKDQFEEFSNFKTKEVERSSSKRRSRRSSISSDDSEPVARPASPTPSIPPPAPPMPVKTQLRQEPDLPIKPKRLPYNASVRSNASMQEELKNVLDIYKTTKQDKLDIKTTPDVFIKQDSTPHEVREWLRAKKFSERAMSQLGSMHGKELFALSRKHLISAFGKEEGIRLDSQITISRNTNGFKTARSSELRDALAKVRNRSQLIDETNGSDEESDVEKEDFSSRA